MDNWLKKRNFLDLLVIKTARDKDDINKAVLEGFFPLIKKVEPSDKIKSKYRVVQNKQSGEIQVQGDYREDIWSIDGYTADEFETIIDWTFYYPYNFNSPYAAYLIPKNIRIGQRVFIEDLIEDFVGSSWNQGDTYRLDSCEAIWNGKEFEYQYKEDDDCEIMIG